MEIPFDLAMDLSSSDYSVGERIRIIRKAAGLTQQELAAALNMQYQNISQYERGIRQPKIETIKRIADVLEVNFVFLLPLNLRYIWDDGWNRGYETKLASLDDKGYQFTPKEADMIFDYNRLNDLGKEMVASFIVALLDQPEKYLLVLPENETLDSPD